MSYIENESEFRIYMEEFGPTIKASRSNYISWLNFISDNGFNINSNLKPNEIIINHLKKNEENRIQYKSKKAYSDFNSALNKYRNFHQINFESLSNDFEKLEIADIPETEKQELRKARVGQGKYRKDLIALWQKCSVSEIEKVDLLIASHILPWCKSTNEERMDKYNGLLLLPNYDKLFDKGLISFYDNGEIIISKKISENEQKVLGLNQSDKLFKIHDENISYLKQHRELYGNLLFEE